MLDRDNSWYLLSAALSQALCEGLCNDDPVWFLEIKNYKYSHFHDDKPKHREVK